MPFILTFLWATMTFASNQGVYYCYSNEKIELSKKSNSYIVRLKERDLDFASILKSNGLPVEDYRIEKKYSHVFLVYGKSDESLVDEGKFKNIPEIDILSPIYISPGGKEFGVTDNICVKFKEKITTEEKNKIIEKYNLKLVKTSFLRFV